MFNGGAVEVSVCLVVLAEGVVSAQAAAVNLSCEMSKDRAYFLRKHRKAELLQ